MSQMQTMIFKKHQGFMLLENFVKIKETKSNIK